jgi:hypothetical protein
VVFKTTACFDSFYFLYRLHPLARLTMALSYFMDSLLSFVKFVVANRSHFRPSFFYIHRDAAEYEKLTAEATAAKAGMFGDASKV